MGLSFRLSPVRAGAASLLLTITSISDGNSNTILAGEKFINSTEYAVGNYGGYYLQWGDLSGYIAGVTT